MQPNPKTAKVSKTWKLKPKKEVEGSAGLEGSCWVFEKERETEREREKENIHTYIHINIHVYTHRYICKTM